MKLTHIVTVLALTLGTASANAGLLSIMGGTNLLMPTNNNFASEGDFLPGQTFNVGGNLMATKALNVEYVYLGHEANLNNHFSVDAQDISTSTQAASLKCFQHTCDASKPKNNVTYTAPSISSSVAAGEFLNFSFWTQTNKNLVKSVVNGSNSADQSKYNYAVALNIPFQKVIYDAILFLDDTGKNKNGVDDNDHDDMVIGLRIFSLPEPSPLVLIGLGLLGLAGSRKIQQMRSQAN